jgi:ATP-dependent DNA ligase
VNFRFSKPMECLPTHKLPTGEQWTYEIKLDGFRIEAVRTQERVILYSKQGKLLTSQFMPIALELENLPPETVLDGELVALDINGVPRFNLLQNYRSGSAHLMYFVFDILLHKGRDVTKLPLSERRDLLKSVVERGPMLICLHGRMICRRSNGSRGSTSSKASSPSRRIAGMNRAGGWGAG